MASEIIRDKQKTFIGKTNIIEVRKLVMEEGAEIGSFNIIKGEGQVLMGKNSVISDHCSILTTLRSAYGHMNEHCDQEYADITDADIYVGENAYIGPYSTICPGVRIGEGAVIGAYSYIMRDVGKEVIIRFKAKRLESDRTWYKKKL